jgi:uncharacterized Zn finger protein
MVVRFRECPRCSGDMNVRSDQYGDYQQCLQCGHVRDLQRELPPSLRVTIQKGRQRPGRGRTAA